MSIFSGLLNAQRSHFAGKENALASSMWFATAGESVVTKPLNNSANVDVLVIGGGINGLTAMLQLTKLGVDAMLIEAGEFGEGASGRNAGMVNPGQFLGPDEIRAILGVEYGDIFVDELSKGPDLVKEILIEHDINCYADFRPVIRAAHDTKTAQMLHRQVKLWSDLGQPVEILEGNKLFEITGSQRWKTALMDYRGFTIQPLAYVRGLANAVLRKGGQLYQNVRATSLSREGADWIVSTVEGHPIRAKKVIMATNAYTGSLHPAFAQALVTCGAFGVATCPLDKKLRGLILPSGHSLYDTHKIPLFLRYDPEGRLMIGSLGNLSDDSRRSIEAWGKRVLKRLWPQLPAPQWSHVWQGTIGLTNHHLPRLLSPEDGLIGTIGCNGRGIAANSYFGRMVADITMGRKVARPLPIEKQAPRAFKGPQQDGLDLAMRLYRNTFLLD
ncbi:NAD(P)/FAD-dependent oxidoreductase [Klebsiella variicola]|uniref:NAD(P)/FAD-dependent oxidoreductase n=1 Tax=Klebsiella variicola TaxID=244366 RepID=UPI00235DE317|nr:FAD-dependent oxidoreductase [Klebsiella variicola]